MDAPAKQKTSQPIISLLFHITLWDVITGLPAGVLIFMATVLFTTLFSIYLGTSTRIAPIIILAIISLFVGELAGITRLRQGPATALSAGLIAAGILGYLWLAAHPGDAFDPLVIGPIGMIVTIIICPVGGWLGARSRKAL
jgi:hypothetical protein